MQKAIFLDKDGTLIEDVPFNVMPEKVRFVPFAFESLIELQHLGYLLVVITNQSGMAMGYFKEAAIKELHNYFLRKFGENKLTLSGFYYCPHHPQGKIKEFSMECGCRKPKAGMLLQAAKELGIDLSQSWMIGDILNDVEAGNTAGCKTILIDNGNETEWILSENRKPDFILKDLRQTATVIKEQENKTNAQLGQC